MASRSARVEPPDGWCSKVMGPILSGAQAAASEGGDLGGFFGAEDPGGGGGVGRHLVGAGGAGDDRGHAALGQEPGDGQLADGAAPLGGEGPVGLEAVEVLVGGGGGEALAAGQPGAGREGL